MSSQSRFILIADDHDAVRTGIKTFLEMRPNLHVVAEARNGRMALERARATKPDIAIVDYSLPELNGLDLTRSLKREMPGLEVLIYTVHDREELVLDLLRAGAKGYVLKSESAEHLLAAIDALSTHRPYFSSALSEKLLKRPLDISPVHRATLTQREREIVQLIAEGQLNKEISRTLDLSVKTVETHRAAAMHKLKINNTAQLVRYALRNNIVQA